MTSSDYFMSSIYRKMTHEQMGVNRQYFKLLQFADDIFLESKKSSVDLQKLLHDLNRESLYELK